MGTVHETFWGRFKAQFVVLVKKNYLLSLRNRRATFLQLMSSFFFIFFIWGVDQSIQANNLRLDTFSVIRNPDPLGLSGVPRCHLSRDANADQCWTLAYAPQADPKVQRIMDAFVDLTDVPPEEVVGFDNSTEIDQFLLQNPNTTQAAVLFTPIPLGSVDWDRVEYTLQFNTTPIFFRGRFEQKQTAIMYPTQLAVEAAIRTVLFEDGGDSVPDVEIDLKKYPHPALETFSTVGTIGPIFIFAAALFSFVIQMSEIVAERELNLRQTMTIMGLYDSAFWLSWTTTEFVKILLSSFLLCTFGAMFQFSFFLDNDFGTYFFLFLFFQLAQMALAFFVSTLLSKSSTASTVGFGFFVLGFILQIVVAFGFPYDLDDDISKAFRYFFAFFPPVLLAKGLNDLGTATATEEGKGIRFSEINDLETSEFTTLSFPLAELYGWLFLDFLVYFVLTLYFDNVLPDKEGVRRPVFYFLRKDYWIESDPTAYSSSTSPVVSRSPSANGIEMNQLNDPENANEDSDVMEEQATVQANLGDYVKDSAIVVNGLSKSFGSYNAVVPNWYQIPNNSLFCLLGPNGAGKTTTIKMLTGALPPTGGDAIIDGHSIRGSGMNHIRHNLGLCPQFDMVWDRLTGRDHLRLYAILSNRVPTEDIEKEVNERLEQVSLTKAADMRTSQYSGGMKRRLSVAIALIGDPKVVFLDEPTTGMDPVHRRQVWDIIDRAKRGRAVILTTHSMEEADILGDRIAILAKGRLRCLGTSIRLKRKFGAGYKITATFVGEEHLYKSFDSSGAPPVHMIARSMSEEEMQAQAAGDAANRERYMKETIEFVRGRFPDCMIQQDELAGENNSLLSFVLPRSYEEKLPEFVKEFEATHRNMGVKAFDISLTTLEDVFLEIARKAEVEEARKMGHLHTIDLSDGTTIQVPVGEKSWTIPSMGITLHLEWFTNEDGNLDLKNFTESRSGPPAQGEGRQ